MTSEILKKFVSLGLGNVVDPVLGLTFDLIKILRTFDHYFFCEGRGVREGQNKGRREGEEEEEEGGG